MTTDQPSALLPIIDEDSHKKCTQCGEIKSLSEFHKRSRSKDGHASQCKECNKKRSKEWYANNREHRLRVGRKWRKNNPEKAREISRRWYEENREYHRKLSQQWYLENKEEHLERNRQWRQDNPDKTREYSSKKSKRLRGTNLEKAWVSVRVAIENGTLPPAWTMVCEKCQEAQARDWHHYAGYAQKNRLTVMPLCVECHAQEHFTEL